MQGTIDCTQSLSCLLVIERLERARCTIARETAARGCASRSLQSLNYCGREKRGTACSLRVHNNSNDRPVLAIAKTSGKLGPNHYRNGAWDRLEGQDSINQSINQAKMSSQYNCCVPGCTNSHNCSGVAFLLGICACPVPPNDPKCLCVADSDPQVPTSFGNGQLAHSPQPAAPSTDAITKPALRSTHSNVAAKFPKADSSLTRSPSRSPVSTNSNFGVTCSSERSVFTWRRGVKSFQQLGQRLHKEPLPVHYLRQEEEATRSCQCFILYSPGATRSQAFMLQRIHCDTTGHHWENAYVEGPLSFLSLFNSAIFHLFDKHGLHCAQITLKQRYDFLRASWVQG